MANKSQQLIQLNLPCSKCGRSLRGQDARGQCTECGMEIYKSLAVAACRGTDPSDLSRVRSGLEAQVWGTLIALGACIIGPLLLDLSISFEIFAVVIAVGLSTVSARRVLTTRSNIWSTRSGWISTTLIVLGSASLVLPATALRLSSMQEVPGWIPMAILMVSAAWFLGECAKLHLLEDVAIIAHGRELGQRARNLRRGVYMVALLLAAALLPFAVGAGDLAQHLTMQFVLISAVSVLVLSLMTTLLYGRVSVQMAHHELLTNTVRRQIGLVDVRLMPDEPDWIVPEN